MENYKLELQGISCFKDPGIKQEDIQKLNLNIEVNLGTKDNMGMLLFVETRLEGQNDLGIDVDMVFLIKDSDGEDFETVSKAMQDNKENLSEIFKSAIIKALITMFGIRIVDLHGETIYKEDKSKWN